MQPVFPLRKTLNDQTLDYLVKLLECLILVNLKQDGPSHSLIRKGAVDSLKDAGVFQALQENYPSVLVRCHEFVYMNGSFKVDMASYSPSSLGPSHPLI